MGVSQSSMNAGDEVVIGITDMDVIKQMQNDHGGLSGAMKECLVGPCVIIHDNGTDAVAMAPSGSVFRLNSKLLVKYSTASAPICDKWAVLTADESQLKAALSGSWESSDRVGELRGLLGQRVKVIQKGPDGIYTVTHNSKTYALDRTCIVEPSSARAKPICVGDMVTLTSNTKGMKRLQDQHGGWSDLMHLLLVGQRVQVLFVLEDGDMLVSSCETHWLVNPRCVADNSELGPLKAGDMVRISSDIKATKELQQNLGHWIEPMKLLAGKTGKLGDFHKTGAVRVNVGATTLLYNPRLLAKISDEETLTTYVVGDTVKVIDDKQKVMALQKGHGEWNDSMSLILGQRGTVKLIFPDGDLRVKIMGIKVTLNPECVVRPDPGGNDTITDILYWKVMLEMILLNDAGQSDESPGTPKDSELEQAVQSNDYELCCALVEAGADVNTLNSKEMTPIMYAAQTGNQDILRRLVRHPDANLEISDGYGDTALHLAVDKSRADSVETLLLASADMRAVNKKQYSAFHLAAMRGHRRILELFLQQQGASVVDLQKDDKFTAIHLAALNNHPDCLRLLIQYKADINIRTNKLQTALHLAVCKKNMECVKVLVENNADLNLKDKNGDTALHDAIRMHQINELRTMSSFLGLGDMLQSMGGSSGGSDELEDIVLYLVQNGASLHILNCARKSPLAECEDSDLKAKLEQILTMQGWAMPQSEPELVISSLQKENEELRRRIQMLEDQKMCTICYDKAVDVTFGCGHMTCSDCANNLLACHICRKKIDNKIKNFL